MNSSFLSHRLPSLRSLSVALLALCTPLALRADPSAIMGGGNFTNGATDATQFDALNTAGAKMCRMNLYPANYWNGTAPVPSGGDGTVLEAHTKGITPMILFEDYASYNDIGNYNKWFAIGQAFATRYRPN